MPSIERPLSGDVLVFDLEEEREKAVDPDLVEPSGRNARTLLKSGPLRMTLVVLGPGGEIPEHSAPGPITVQPIRGTLRLSVADETHEIGPGQVLCAGAGVDHAVSSEKGATFLLTVSHVEGAQDRRG